MKLLITCGTTPFPSLANEIYNYTRHNKTYSQVILQETSSDFLTEDNFIHVKLYSDQQSFFDESDLVITHAGAGTVYFLLKNGIKFIVIPNMERSDKHQIELANYIEKNNYAEVCHNLSKLDYHVEKCIASTYSKYKKISFNSNLFYENFFKN